MIEVIYKLLKLTDPRVTFEEAQWVVFRLNRRKL